MPLPQRLRIHDEMGRLRTLEAGLSSHIHLTANTRQTNNMLILGLGPEPQHLARQFSHMQNIYYMECPAFAQAMPQGWYASIPSHWIKLSETEYKRLLPQLADYQVIFYVQGLSLFSSFWGPQIGLLQAIALGHPPPAAQKHLVLLGEEDDLVRRELALAFEKNGIQSLCLNEQRLLEHLKQNRPSAVCSLNLSGLDARGDTFHLLQALNIPVAVWLVDNPWHILSRLKSPWWRKLSLFVTDASFIPQLRKHGAHKVFHLPLGAWSMEQQPEYAGLPLKKLLFVGHSSFPRRDKFFAASANKPELLEKARQTIEQGHRPDYHWWETELGSTMSLWPGNAGRTVGFGAETSSLLYKMHWLKEAAQLGLTIVGDEGWQPLQRSGAAFDLRPPVDYYTALFPLYKAATYTLNCTSLLLPAGLSQRHFDVWSAGGFLLSDLHEGLAIFNKELVGHITLSHPKQLEARLEQLEKDPSLYRTLGEAWRKHIHAEHLYEHRAAFMLETLSNI